MNTNPGFTNLAPPLGAPLDPTGAALNPPSPAGWEWYAIDGAICRDGTPAGFFVHYGTADKLLWYLEGGGACISPGFCTYNPANVNQILAGNGETAITSVGGAIAGRQQPPPTGVFETTNAANPFKDWSMIYTPYCTGDVHFGAKPNAAVPGVAAPQQFVGYSNMQKFVARVVPTFQNKVSRVVLTGASAGGFGAALNFSMVQDAFGSVRVDVLDDSGPPFNDQFMPPCMQTKWRNLWNYEASLPPDCAECRQADGGGLVHLADFLMRKHSNTTLAIVSSMQDEIIRLFYSAGNNGCAAFDTADPVGAFATGSLPPDIYTNGLNDLRAVYQGTGRLSTYYLGGVNITFHQHIWRARFYDATAGSESIAQFTTNFLNGQMAQIGP